MIAEDVFGLKEKPEDTRYINKITSKSDPKHKECGQRILFQTFPSLELQTRTRAWSSPPKNSKK